MVKKRLIYTLLYKNGKFCLSRNFRNQIIGDFNWLFKNYNFAYVSKYIDELIILNVEEDRSDRQLFLDTVQKILDRVFVPVGIGGGITDIETAKAYFEVGADKLVINSALHKNPELISKIASIYGAQAIIASVDYKDKPERPYIDNGKLEIPLSLVEYIEGIQQLDIGEILLNSINQDGTGFGFDKAQIIEVSNIVSVPLIVAGGAGRKEHFLEVGQIAGVNAFSTANLLNFIGDALPIARRYLLEKKIDLAQF